MLAPKQKHDNFNTAYRKAVKESFCKTEILGPLVNPDKVHIAFKGPVAAIPAMKNSKVSGTNILRCATKARLSVMTEVFLKSVNYQVPRFTGKVFALILLSYRGQAFDEDNCLTTVRDWLEPRFIRNKDKEWGVGVVTNDSQINAFARKKEKGSLNSDLTEIILCSEKVVAERLENFIDFMRLYEK